MYIGTCFLKYIYYLAVLSVIVGICLHFMHISIIITFTYSHKRMDGFYCTKRHEFRIKNISTNIDDRHIVAEQLFIFIYYIIINYAT